MATAYLFKVKGKPQIGKILSRRHSFCPCLDKKSCRTNSILMSIHSASTTIQLYYFTLLQDLFCLSVCVYMETFGTHLLSFCVLFFEDSSLGTATCKFYLFQINFLSEKETGYHKTILIMYFQQREVKYSIATLHFYLCT